MRVGVPRELPVAGRREPRVALVPSDVAELRAEGAELWVERGAGENAGFSDQDYVNAGASLAHTRSALIARAEILVSIGRLSAADLAAAPPQLSSLAFHQLGLAPAALRAAYAASEIVAIGLDRLKDGAGGYPVLARLSELTGALAPQIAARLLESGPDGRVGMLLGRLPGVPPAEVLILGAGALGTQAAAAFAGIGASVHLLDRDLAALRQAAARLPAHVTTRLASKEAIARAVGFANVVVGAVRTPGEATPNLISEAMVRGMRPGAVLLDFSINEGGCAATSRPIYSPDDAYNLHGVMHFTMPNATSLVARTASRLLSQAILPYVRLLDSGVTPKAHRVFAPAVYFGDGGDDRRPEVRP